MAKEYLPGTIGERVRDLRKEAGMTMSELENALEISTSSMGRIERKNFISTANALKIAKFFNVSVDFVLAKTDNPKVINYDLEVLGLTPEAAEKLYTNQVDVDVLNLLIEHDKFGELTHLIACYLKDYMAEATRTLNAYYSSLAEFASKCGNEEAADYLSAQTQPVYSAEISKIQNCLNVILKETKKALGDKSKEFHKEMRTTVAELIKGKIRVNGALRKINAVEYADDIVNMMTKNIPLTEEMKTNLRDALVPIFKTDWRGVKK